MSQCELNIIGDIAGRFDTLMKLVERMPKANFVLLGDLIDRGPDSKKVLDWARMMESAGLAKVLLGNHEHMMIDWVKRKGGYQQDIWLYNGGGDTLASFGLELGVESHARIQEVLKEYIDWLEQLPPLHFADGNRLLMSHAPLDNEFIRLLDAKNDDLLDYPLINLIWNRIEPDKRFIIEGTEVFFVHGHNKRIMPKWYKDEKGPYGVNIDTSIGKQLTGLHYPSMTLYQESYI